MRSQWCRALNENCHFVNMKTVENKQCIHHLKRCGSKSQKKKLYLWDVPALRYFSMPVDCQQLNNGLLWTPINIERQISLFLLFLLKFSALTHFPGPFVVLYSMLPSIRTVPVSGHLKQKLTFWYEAPFSVLSKRSISNESWTFHL